ncbi:YDG/SRA domain-containing protein [Crossiella sp. NPDC003009]
MAGLDIVGLLDRLRVNTASGQPARHQPLLLLWAAGRAARGAARMTPWQSVRAELTELLDKFGRPGAKASPEYPFVALAHTAFWELDGHSEAVPAAHSSGVARWLTRNKPSGGLTEPVYRTLATDHGRRNAFAGKIIDRYFPGEDPEALLAAVQLGDLTFDRFGEVPWAPVGTHFVDRDAAFYAHVHRQRQAGICGRQNECAQSIVVNGGYEDDDDLGDVIIYTGQGGNEEKKQIADQTLTLGNKALAISYEQGEPVRVIRGYKGDPRFSPESGYRYDGLYRVAAYWSEKGKSGFLVWRYKMVKYALSGIEVPLAEAVVKAEKAAPAGAVKPGRKPQFSNKIDRSIKVVKWVKKKHDSRCQICSLRLEVPNSYYAETAHIKPLGIPFDGPDVPENTLCLCPNHHALFDRGAVLIEDDLTIVDEITGEEMGKLVTVAGHNIEVEYLAWHRNYFRNRAIS